MDDFVMPLMLGLDVSSLTMSLVNIASASGAETALADSVEAALHPLTHLEVERVGDTVIGRTAAGHSERVVIAGHLGTAPSEEGSFAYVEMGRLVGPGASDAKGALAVMLKAAAAGGHRREVTFVFHADGPEGRGDLTAEVAGAEFVLLAEPTNSTVVGGAVDHPWAQQLIGLTEVDAATDAGAAHGRLASLAVPAVAFGPGDPSAAGSPAEYVPTAELARCEFALRQWLTA